MFLDEIESPKVKFWNQNSFLEMDLIEFFNTKFSFNT